MSGPTVVSSCCGQPTPSLSMAFSRYSTVSRRLASGTYSRLTVVHTWPLFTNLVPRTASSDPGRSAWVPSTAGALPPSSNEVRIIWCAASIMSCFPTAVEPVSDSLRSSPERIIARVTSGDLAGGQD